MASRSRQVACNNDGRRRVEGRRKANRSRRLACDDVIKDDVSRVGSVDWRHETVRSASGSVRATSVPTMQRSEPTQSTSVIDDERRKATQSTSVFNVEQVHYQRVLSACEQRNDAILRALSA